MNETERIQATLEPPGAGIAWYYLLANKLVVRPFIEGRTSWEEGRALFTRRAERGLKACAGLSASQLERRVLVPRLAGLEDSSRYWSMAMTCRHLEVVSSLMADVIVRLSRAEAIGERVDFAAVKPVDVPASTLDAWRTFTTSVLPRLDTEVVDRRARGTVPHPWFGDLDARGWLWLMGFHAWVHARQLEAIRAQVV